jgi:hypothetical protein
LVDSLDESIGGVMEKYVATFDELDDLQRRQFRLERILVSMLELHRHGSGTSHPAEKEVREYVERGREIRNRSRKILEQRTEARIVGSGTVARVSEARPPKMSVWPVETSTALLQSRRDVPAAGRLREIYDVLAAVGRPMRPDDIADALVGAGRLSDVDNQKATVAAHLSRGVRGGLFVRPDRGLYAISEEAVDPTQ